MSIKVITMAAATAVSLGLASVAPAQGTAFSFGEMLASESSLMIGTVRAEADGVLEIYNYQGGVMGELLGATMIRQGANQMVRVNVGQRPRFDVLAVVRINGEVVAQKDYDIDFMGRM